MLADIVIENLKVKRGQSISFGSTTGTITEIWSDFLLIDVDGENQKIKAKDYKHLVPDGSGDWNWK